MKKFLLKPGFELIFCISLIVILALPPVLLAQSTKELEIRIENGDTTINGRNIKALSATDRREALKDISHLQASNGGNTQRMYFKQKDSTGGITSRMEFRRRESGSGDRRPVITENIIIKDSLGNMTVIRPGKKFRGVEASRGHKNRMDDEEGFDMRRQTRNTQDFNYMNTDNEGISTHINFHVSEVSNEDLKKMPYVEGSKFEITDLNLVPEFTTGKILLMFNLPAKTIAEVKLHDSEGKLMWSEKSTGGSFRKTFIMGLNGIYYLQVKQGNSIAIKRIVKE